MLIIGLFLFNGAFFVGCQPNGLAAGSPENITVHIIDSKTVEVFWSTKWKNVERYDISYNPTEDRVITQVAGNSHSVVLRQLRPGTQYQVTVSAIINGKNYKSRRLVFKTGNDSDEITDSRGVELDPSKPTKPSRWRSTTQEIINPDPTALDSKYTPQTSTTVRGVEIGLVLLALVVWIIAIALFFHRWGKIRMLLPYQPDYKTQQSLKVPGTAASMASGRSGTNGTQGQQEGPGCVQTIYEKVTSCRCCCDCNAGDRTSANEESDFDE
ncbi:hypothetical protein RUM44_002808 [Polyplax serrata]|uniref:Fibronectin type-III domain-containing protein n=1 Tax=Polyplax serrata TaxID=468196 RepID=A0ABR1AFS0_POLSC